MNLLDSFRLGEEKEDFQQVKANIVNGVEFKGTNLWILIFAIFIASLGLNVNSPAVIIGAMLISPLMGPIMGLGFGMAINDLSLLRKSVFSYAFCAGIGLGASAIFFLLSPIDEAHSEILARTSPTIYDVLIALFGGLAGMLATSSRLKGNVIPGVAIATALMPPLCTAGYGLATLQFPFFFGAFYLFIINTVFIALASLITARLLRYPFEKLPKKQDERRVRRIVYAVVAVTTLPSIYLGYDMVQKNRFLEKANEFVNFEANFPNDYLLKKTIDPRTREILLVYGGEVVAETEVEKLRGKLANYGLQDAQLVVHQGFAYLEDATEENQLAFALSEQEKHNQSLQMQLDSLKDQSMLRKQVFLELKTQYPTIHSFLLQPAIEDTLNDGLQALVCGVFSTEAMSDTTKTKIADWLKVRIPSYALSINFDR